jgi:hypothetical protein
VSLLGLVDLALLPVRVARQVTGALANAVATPVRDLVVIDGMPEGVPEAALRPEPQLPAPAEWPFGEHFPRTCGTGRFASGAVFWTDFLYDDHGATGVPVSIPAGGAPPRGTYVYPAGPAANNGADIFRVAIGLTDAHTWWRIDWNTLIDASVPIALFTFDTDRGQVATDVWPAGAGVWSAGIDLALLVSGNGATLIDLTTQARTPVDHAVDLEARSFIAQVPRSVVEPTGTWTVRLAAGLANPAGDRFADVAAIHGALPGQPNVYNVVFRTTEQETPSLNFWSDAAQAAALTDGDVSEFSLAVPWDQLAERHRTDEPVRTGTSTRWYVSSVELGQGVGTPDFLSTKPQFLGRVQPYSVCLPSTYAPGQKLPLTLLLHSLALGQNQYAAIDPRFLHEVCEGRDSIVVTPLARGPSCWYFDEGELDVWEVWARVAEQLGADANRTVIAGYSMGGYGAYRLGLAYPEVFAQAVVLAGPPTCGVRLLPDVDIPADPADLDPESHCAREGDTLGLLVNARWLPFVIAHGLVDELVPFPSALDQVLELDRLGYRYRFTVYPAEDHVVFVFQDRFDDAVAHMGTGLRQADPGHITFAWYPQLTRPDLGLGPSQVWWLSDLTADSAARGKIAEVDARSYARPDQTRTARRRRGFVPHFDPTPGLYTEQVWLLGPPPPALPTLTLKLTGVAGLSVDVVRAGLAAWPKSTIAVATDTLAHITLAALPVDVTVDLDDTTAGPTVPVPAGRHRITLTRNGGEPAR